jgi:NAD(P)-dependent dehydrogenase (short-subunit alcohol dehydrogenase family)
MSQGFLKLLGKEKKGTIVNVTSALGLTVVPGFSSYSLSKLVTFQLQAFIGAENPNVTAVAMHPGIVKTDNTHPAFEPFAKDTPALPGGLGVWLATEQAAFLNGKYIESNWSVEDLVAKKEEIVSKGLLSIALKGEFGSAQFE